MNWKMEALELYRAGQKISAIAEKVGRSRKTVSQYVNGLPGLDDINRSRVEKAAAARREYKRNWKRNRCGAMEAAQIKRQHEIDAMVLSRDRCYEE